MLKVTIGPFEVAGGLGGALRVSRTLRGAIEVLGTLFRFSASCTHRSSASPGDLFWFEPLEYIHTGDFLL